MSDNKVSKRLRELAAGRIGGEIPVFEYDAAADEIDRLSQPTPASTGREPIGYVSANTMEDLRRGNSVMAAILTRNDVAGVDCALYAAPVAARELDVEAEYREFNEWFERAKFGGMRESMWTAWEARAARSAAQSPAPVSTEQAGDAWISVEDRLPPRYRRAYLVYTPANKCVVTGHVSINDEGQEQWYHFASGRYIAEQVSHWMELPVAPSPNNSPVGGKD